MTTAFPQIIAPNIAKVVGLTIGVGWVIYFVFAPTIGFDLLATWHDEQRGLQVVLLLATAFSYLGLLLAVPVVRVPLLIWVVLGLGALSALVSTFPIHAAAEVALLIQLFLLGIFFATLAYHYPQVASLGLQYTALLIGAVYLVGVAANYVGVIVEHRKVDMEVLILGYSNRRFASALHALILPLITWLALDRSARPALRNSSWGIATVLWVINLAIGTRAIWAAFFAGGVALWWFGGEADRRALKALMFSAAAGALIYVLLLLLAPAVFPVAGSMQSRVGDIATSSSRVDLWRAAMHAIFAHPWLGIGPAHFANLHELAGAHPHNWVLQIASEWGLPALAIFLIAVFRWLRCLRIAARSRANETRGDALPAIALSVLAAVAYGLVDGNWVMPVSQSLAVILAGAAFGLAQHRMPLQKVRVLSFSGLATMAIVVASGTTLGLYTYRTAGLQTQIEKDFTLRTHGQDFTPRFWQQGYIPQESPE